VRRIATAVRAAATSPATGLPRRTEQRRRPWLPQPAAAAAEQPQDLAPAEREADPRHPGALAVGLAHHQIADLQGDRAPAGGGGVAEAPPAAAAGPSIAAITSEAGAGAAKLPLARPSRMTTIRSAMANTSASR
jgi:hypothetical protein